MKEKRLRRRADHLPAGVEINERFDDRGKKHISIIATQGAANLRDIASLRPQDLKLGRVFASSDDIRFVMECLEPRSAAAGLARKLL